MKTFFVPCYSRRSPLPAVGKALGKLGGYGRVGLISTAQHINQLEGVKDFLLENNRKAVVCGQILGCDLSNALKVKDKVDAFLYIGSGRFHPLGLSLLTDKPVFVANPYSDSVDEITNKERNMWLRRKKARIAGAMEAETFGILVSTKPGQFKLRQAMEVRDRLKKRGKNCFLFSGSEVTPELVLGFRVDAWVNTACPRITDDFFEKPVLNPDELRFIS